MNACTPRCGWCGACTDDRYDYPPPVEYLQCDACGKDAFRPKTLSGVGIACSDFCLNRLCLQHEQAMARK